MRWLAAVIVPALGACATVSAQEPECPRGRTALPAPWETWSAARLLASAVSIDSLGAARFGPGEAIDLRLHPDPEVSYVTLPRGAGEASSFGGLAALHVERAGAYAVGLGGFAWIDLTRDGQPTATAAFGHGPDCSPVRKVVRFDLIPGDYVLEVSGNPTADLRLMVAATPPAARSE